MFGIISSMKRITASPSSVQSSLRTLLYRGDERRAAISTSIAVLALLVAGAAPAAGATRFERIAGVESAGTPARYDRVGILKVGPARARNVLVLNPGTSASAAYFAPLAESIVARAPGWQVWAVERREN